MLEVWESLPEGTLCQLINNKLIMSPSPKEIHQEVLNRINVRIFNFLEISKIGQVRISPYDVHFSKQNILQPDLFFLRNENLDRIEKDGLYGSPDMIIEVSSPSTSKIDYGEKKSVYEAFGVQEYFIVDPGSKMVYPYFLDKLDKKEYEAQETQVAKIISLLLHTEITF